MINDHHLTGTHCCYCEREFIGRLPLIRTKEHIIPKFHGGDNDPANMAGACEECNRLKGKKLPLAFAWSIKLWTVDGSIKNTSIADRTEVIIKNCVRLHNRTIHLKPVYKVRAKQYQKRREFLFETKKIIQDYLSNHP